LTANLVEITDLLGGWHNQKIFYRPRWTGDVAYVRLILAQPKSAAITSSEMIEIRLCVYRVFARRHRLQRHRSAALAVCASI